MAASTKKGTVKSGGVRFPEESSAHSHVHFDEKLHDSVVMVIPESNGNFLVKVGFLKAQHKYEIDFTLPEIPSLGTDICTAPIPNPHIRVLNIGHPSKGGLHLRCEYMPHQEGVVCEELTLLSESKEEACARIKVQARVMDRHHGTPMLLEGVRCVGAELEYDSEQSDWQGFD